MSKKFLFIFRLPPHQGCLTQETLDTLLTAAAFDQSVSLLFADAGVFQLKAQQIPEPMEKKDTLAIFRALEIYDVTQLYVEVESLQESGLKPADLCLPVMEYYRKDIAGLMQQHDVLISC